MIEIAQPGDILLTHGPWMLSDLIASRNEGFSHASIVVATDPLVWVAESAPPVAKVLKFDTLARNSIKIVLLHDLSLTTEERRTICDATGDMLGEFYGLDRFAGLALDEFLGVQWFGDHFFLSRSTPVCSVFVAEARARIGKNFGVEAQGATPGEIARFARSHPDIYQWVEIKS